MPSKPVLSDSDKAAVREKLIALCEAHWSAQGYKKTNIKSLCSQAQISIGTFYTLYPAKEDLFLATIEAIQDRLKEMVLDINSRAGTKKGFAESIKALFREYDRRPFLYNVHTPDFQSFSAKLPKEALQKIKLDSFAFFRQAVQTAGLRLRTEEAQAYGVLSALLSTAGAKERLSVTCDALAVFDFMADRLVDALFE